MTRVFLLACSAACAAAACGGAVEQPADGTSAPPVSTLQSSNQNAPLYGTWDLVSLERSDAFATEVHDVLQIELRPDGGVTARRCGKTYYEPGSIAVRCGDAASYDCFYGTVQHDGDTWRIDLPDLPTTTSAQQRTVEAEGTGIKIHYIMPKSPAGSFIRAPDADRTEITSSYAVANCKGAH